MGYSPKGHKEWDMAEQLRAHTLPHSKSLLTLSEKHIYRNLHSSGPSFIHMYCRKWHSDTNVIIVFQFQYYSKCLISMKTAVDLYCISFLISSHSHRNLWKVFFLLLKKKLRCRMTDPASCLNSILLPSSLIKASLLFFFFFKE